MLRATKSLVPFFRWFEVRRKQQSLFPKNVKQDGKKKMNKNYLENVRNVKNVLFRSEVNNLTMNWTALTICLNNFEKIFPQSSNDRKYRRTLALKPIYSSVDKFELYKLPEKPQQERQILIIFEKLDFKMIPSRSFFP